MQAERWLYCEDHNLYIKPYINVKTVEEGQRQGHGRCSLTIKLLPAEVS